jgi:hemolysin activation/secretion protein
MQFDRQGAGGVTYGSVGVVPGELRLTGESATLDRSSGRRADGGFLKWTLDVARLQPVERFGITLFGRLAAQKTDQNLDSSEKFSIGGPYAVRAYPIGEGSGDEGVLAQIELRTVVGAFSPFVFVDGARSKFNAKADSLLFPPEVNTRSLIGAGIGTRVNRGMLAAEGVLGWRLKGGLPLAEEGNSSIRAWLTLSYRL